MKKIISMFIMLTLMVVNVFAEGSDAPDNGLYKDFKAGEVLADQYKNQKIKCEGNFILTPNSECYIVSTNESLFTESDFILLAVTINNKIAAMHLVKEKQGVANLLNFQFFEAFYNVGFEALYVTNIVDKIENNTKKVSLADLYSEHNRLVNIGSISAKDFTLDVVFTNNSFDKNEIVNIFDYDSPNYKFVSRIVDLIEIYDFGYDKWTIRIDFTNSIITNELISEELSKKAEFKPI